MNSETLISASIQGGILAAVVWLVAAAMPTMPPVAKVWLWRLVFLKFALGFAGIGNIPLRVLPAVPVEPAASVTDSIAYETVDTGAVSPPLVVVGPQPRQIPWGWLWLAGVGLAGGYVVFGVGRTIRMVHRARPITEEWVIDELSNLSRNAGIRCAPRLLESSETKTALLAWSLRPAILLPAGLIESDPNVSADSSDVRLMLAHEVAHLVNRDLAWNLLAAGVKGIFFFHPMVWLSAGRSHVAQETAADERAVRMTGASPKVYGEMLLRATVAGDLLRAAPGFVAVAGSIRALRERLDAMGRLSQKPPLALRIGAFAAIAALFPGYCLMAKAQEAPKKDFAPPQVSVRKGARSRSQKKSPNLEGIAHWSRIQMGTGKVTGGWIMNSLWNGRDYSTVVFTRTDPKTHKKMSVRDDRDSVWIYIEEGKVQAVRRPKDLRPQSVPGMPLPALAPLPSALGSVALPKAGTELAAPPTPSLPKGVLPGGGMTPPAAMPGALPPRSVPAAPGMTPQAGAAPRRGAGIGTPLPPRSVPEGVPGTGAAPVPQGQLPPGVPNADTRRVRPALAPGGLPPASVGGELPARVLAPGRTPVPITTPQLAAPQAPQPTQPGSGKRLLRPAVGGELPARTVPPGRTPAAIQPARLAVPMAPQPTQPKRGTKHRAPKKVS